MNARCALIILIPLLASAAPKSDEPASEPQVRAAQPVAPAQRSDSGGRLSSGDTVSLQIVEDKEPGIEKRISDTGDLEVPYIGRVHVAGKTCADAAAQIKKLLEQDYYHHATVRLAINQFSQHVSGSSMTPVTFAKINVSGGQGALRAPGMQEYAKTDTITVSAAVLKAGPTIYAKQSQVKVTRKKGDTTETIVVNVERILKEGKLNEDVEVHDGDYIFVPQKGVVF